MVDVRSMMDTSVCKIVLTRVSVSRIDDVTVGICVCVCVEVTTTTGDTVIVCVWVTGVIDKKVEQNGVALNNFRASTMPSTTWQALGG